MISNPDVGHHDSYAAFDIGGKMTDCVVVFTTGKPFAKPGDTFFEDMVTGLVPVDDLSTMYTADDAANFRDVFGKNTSYVIDPEETLADNFAYTLIYGLDGMEYYTPGIIQAIDGLLKAGYAADKAAQDRHHRYFSDRSLLLANRGLFYCAAPLCFLSVICS